MISWTQQAIRTTSHVATLFLAGLAIFACGGVVDPSEGADGGSGPSQGQSVDVSVAPPSAATLPAGTIAFAAAVTGTPTRSVTWTVVPSGGGTINSSGLYTAPSSIGTYSVVATSVADPTKSGTAQVTVADVPTTSIIPADRRTVWNPGIPGGIPVRTTVCATVTPAYASSHAVATFGTDGTGNAQPAIQYAINNCPLGQVVFLPAGSYRLNAEINLNRGITLRGAGATQTKLLMYAADAAVYIWPASGWASWGSATNVTADVQHGATSFSVSSAAGYSVGDIIQIDQLDDTSYLFYGGCPWFKRSNSGGYGPATAPRSMGQTAEITAINGNQITIGTPIHLAFSLSRSPQIFKTQGGALKNAGLESLYVTGGQAGNIHMIDCAYCWVKNVESDGTSPAGIDGTSGPGRGMSGDHILIERSYRSEVRGSYFHHASSVVEGGNAYGISLSMHTSDTLIEDNIVNWMNKPLTMRATGGGNVVAYNYIDNAWTHNFSPMQETTIDMGHASFPFMELVEGNWAAQIATDIVWGNSGWMTVFRNYASGLQSRGGETDSVAAIDFEARAVSMNVVGNVLGTAGAGFVYEVHGSGGGGAMGGRGQRAVFRLGNNANGGSGDADQSVYEPFPFVPTFGGFPTSGYTLLRTANWDNVRNQIDVEPGIPVPDSLYLPGKPAFFGSNPWPWVNPSGSTKVNLLPAKQRFDAGVPVAP